MDQLLLHNANVILRDRTGHGGVLARDGRIAQVFAEADAPTGLSVSETIDLHELYLAPGMIDIHIHGSAGVDVQNADQEGLRRLSAFLLGEGVTGYLATFVPAGEEEYRRATREIEAYIAHQGERGNRGARLLGIHFEGPFVSHEKCGALQRRHFQTYDGDPRSVELFARPSNRASSYARAMTLAPEVEGGLALVEELTRVNVRAFIGHTAAAPETLDRALVAGARHITHFPNALEPLHHRRPGAVAWGLLNGGVTIDCIADFHHVHPLMLRLMHQNKTAEGMALISDAILAAGLGDGEYVVWGDRIAVKNGLTALMEGPAKGTIAGSVITMRDALKNISSLGVPIYEAARMSSTVPARAAGLEGEYGSIEAGKRADLIAVDGDFNVRCAVVDGETKLRTED